MRSERIESDKVAEAFFSPVCRHLLLFLPSSYNSSKNEDLVSDNGRGIVVFMHICHLVYGCDDFNVS